MGAEGLFLIAISELSPYYKIVKHKTEEAEGPVLPLTANEGPVLVTIGGYRKHKIDQLHKPLI